MVHEREDNFTCGPIMPQGGIQVFLIFNIFYKKELKYYISKKIAVLFYSIIACVRLIVIGSEA
jgi:hypothetical protein